jgi:hypothetical protein
MWRSLVQWQSTNKKAFLLRKYGSLQRFMFSKCIKILEGKIFDNIETSEHSAMVVLETKFGSCFQQW